MMINTHDLTSQSRIAHAQRLTEANEYRLAKIATSADKRTAQRRNAFKDLLAIIATHIHVARAQA